MVSSYRGRSLSFFLRLAVLMFPDGFIGLGLSLENFIITITSSYLYVLHCHQYPCFLVIVPFKAFKIPGHNST